MVASFSPKHNCEGQRIGVLCQLSEKSKSVRHRLYYAQCDTYASHQKIERHVRDKQYHRLEEISTFGEGRTIARQANNRSQTTQACKLLPSTPKTMVAMTAVDSPTRVVAVAPRGQNKKRHVNKAPPMCKANKGYFEGALYLAAREKENERKKRPQNECIVIR